MKEVGNIGRRMTRGEGKGETGKGVEGWERKEKGKEWMERNKGKMNGGRKWRGEGKGARA